MASDPRGVALTASAFLIWGLGPIFWKLLVHLPAGELLAHRVLWAAVMLTVLLIAQRRWAEVRSVLASRGVVLTLVGTTVLIAGNWLLYIWAVVNEQILQASLGYYINPLVTVLLAMIFLGERLRRDQWWCLGLAAVGVGVMVGGVGEVPLVALVLAFSFGFYALLRKQVRAEAEVGLLVETLLLLPLVLSYLVWVEIEGRGAFGHRGAVTDGLLIASGLITALPLVLFTQGARRIPLTTAGFLQFLAPTLQFLLAVFVYGEPFTRTHLAAFLFIWAALALFSWNLHRRWRRSQIPSPG